MITFSILFILLYTYCTYKIREKSGSWSQFQPFEAPNPIVFLIWFVGTILLFIGIVGLIIHLITSGIIP
jgi:hypothetical protein